ncbi:hypothetical protein ASPSYDRAFT_52632 [Aspergillus sydowii CBS 593.65]|uniref:Uncharacterized protein n=1 Tax=Aspergillus sydowii CBS 593.65 TaxID=1036612 RepID=A0A1L9SXS8_9EURO|nr:uncharacterized protein ASPSYDRAFT_52632 [Aspergillus sydowii CBS 593.65]OJJ52004.1 hypothetical protein ASPSYDRAFT_52632 [Aspergillus sydowii CBS 593.65]
MIHDHMERNGSHAGSNSAASDIPSSQHPENVFEDIHADDDAFQFIGSVKGYATTAKSVSAKIRATQCLGDLSDPTLLQISENHRGRTLGTNN